MPPRAMCEGRDLIDAIHDFVHDVTSNLVEELLPGRSRSFRYCPWSQREFHVELGEGLDVDLETCLTVTTHDALLLWVWEHLADFCDPWVTIIGTRSDVYQDWAIGLGRFRRPACEIASLARPTDGWEMHDLAA